MVLLLLLVNFVDGFRLELMYISLIISIWPKPTHIHGFQRFALLPQFTEITLFLCTNRINLLNRKFRQASHCCKSVLEAAKLAYATKTKESTTSQKLASRDFCRIANSVLNQDKSAIPPLFNGPKVLSSAFDKAKLFAENFCINSNLHDSAISLPISGQIFGLFLLFSVTDNFEWFWMKSSQEYLVNARVP